MLREVETTLMEKEEVLICMLGAAGTLADYITTKIGLTIPELAEMNPLANPIGQDPFRWRDNFKMHVLDRPYPDWAQENRKSNLALESTRLHKHKKIKPQRTKEKLRKP